MNRIINTDDVHYHIKAYPGLGVFRDKILAIVASVVGRCPTAKVDMTTDELLDRVLEIIDDEITSWEQIRDKLGCKPEDDNAEVALEIARSRIKEEVEAFIEGW